VERTWKEIEHAVTDEVSEPDKKPLETGGVKEATVATTVAPAPEKEAAPKVIYVPVKQETEYEKNVRRYKEWKKSKAEEKEVEKQRKYEEKIAELELRRAKNKTKDAKSKAKTKGLVYKGRVSRTRQTGVVTKTGDGSSKNKRVTHEEWQRNYEKSKQDYERRKREIESYNAKVRAHNAKIKRENNKRRREAQRTYKRSSSSRYPWDHAGAPPPPGRRSTSGRYPWEHAGAPPPPGQ